MLDNKVINDLYLRMVLNAEPNKDNEFNKSIKFVVDENIGDDCPVSHYTESFHDMLLLAYKLYLNGKLWSVGIMDGKKNYNGSFALDYWRDEYLRDIVNERNREIDEKLERLKKLEKMVKKFNITDEKLEEYIKE